MAVASELLSAVVAVSHLVPPPFPVCIWAVHFLSLSEAVQEKLHEELVEVLGDEPVSLEKIPQLRSVLSLFHARDCSVSVLH